MNSKVNLIVEEVLFNVEHRHWVFTIPACLRWCFRFHRNLLGDLSDVVLIYLPTTCNR
ncbi:MAG: hypothetical protein AB1414_09575 [bacterium]